MSVREEALKIIDEEFQSWAISAEKHHIPLHKWKTYQVLKTIKERIQKL